MQMKIFEFEYEFVKEHKNYLNSNKNLSQSTKIHKFE